MGPEYTISKPDDLFWKEWYSLWRRHPEDPIGETLKLPLRERGTRLWTQDGGLIRGSELFLDITECLSRAFRLHDEPLIIYFMSVHQRIRNNSLDPQNGFSLNYGKVIRVAIEEGYFDFGEQLFHKIKDDPSIFSWNHDKYTQKIVRALGRIGRRDLVRRYLDVKQITNARVPIMYYIIGLVEGGQNQEALRLVRSQVYSSEEEYRKLIEAALRQDNWDMIEAINQLIYRFDTYKGSIEISLDDWLKQFALAAAKVGRPDLAVPYEDLVPREELVRALAIESPDVALQYLEANPGLILMEPIITSNWELLNYCFHHHIIAKPSFDSTLETLALFCYQVDATECLSIILPHGLYELLPIWEEKPNQFSKINTKSSYKDLILYCAEKINLSGVIVSYLRSAEQNLLLQTFKSTPQPRDDLAVLKVSISLN